MQIKIRKTKRGMWYAELDKEPLHLAKTIQSLAGWLYSAGYRPSNQNPKTPIEERVMGTWEEAT